eukprot:130280_1
MEGYRQVRKAPEKGDNPNEVRVTSGSGRGRFIGQIMKLLEDDATRRITVRSLGGAIQDAVSVVETVRRRVEGLAFVLRLEQVVLVDQYEPLTEGNQPKTVERKAPAMIIELTTMPTDADKASVGYRDPADPAELRQPRGARGERSVSPDEGRSKAKREPRKPLAWNDFCPGVGAEAAEGATYAPHEYAAVAQRPVTTRPPRRQRPKRTRSADAAKDAKGRGASRDQLRSKSKDVIAEPSAATGGGRRRRRPRGGGRSGGEERPRSADPA